MLQFSVAIILMGKRELVALLNLSSWCLVMVERLFLAVPWGCLRFVIVVFPDHTHLLFLQSLSFILKQCPFGFGPVRMCLSAVSSHCVYFPIRLLIISSGNHNLYK